jgi:radical SAM protein with 4Fe4S-binding SPASM domain
VDVSVKSIITTENVNRLVEMVEHLYLRFPKIRKYKLQIVEDASLFGREDIMRAFYTQFTSSFFEAEEKGRRYGIDVYVLASKYIDMLIEHYCGGEMCVTPDGSITICHRISSPQEKGYQDFVYGEIHNDGSISVDAEKFKTLISHDIACNIKCTDCFAKWHCGGGCFAQSYVYSDKQLDIICDWTRDFIKQILLKQMAENT